MTTHVLTFDEALADSEEHDNQERNILLGNGFSISWDADVFRYHSLFDEAELADLSIDKTELFDSLATRDFERVIEHLQVSAKLIEVYDAKVALAKRFKHDAKVVRRGLAEVIAARHPERSTEVDDMEGENARSFLSNFDRIYSLNYDLLMYWAVVRKESSFQTPVRDGFQWPSAQGPYNRLVWKEPDDLDDQEIFHLHGALHLYVEERRLYKVRYSGMSLPQQILLRLEERKYPLVVTEGTSAQKLDRISRSRYLSYCHKHLAQASGSLFVHGMSLSENDDHILSLIESEKSGISRLYVGLFGDVDDEGNKHVARRAREIRKKRSENQGHGLAVRFYDSGSATVWR